MFPAISSHCLAARRANLAIALSPSISSPSNPRMISLSLACCSSACSSARSAHRLASPCNPATLAARLCLAASSDGAETVTTASSLLLPPLAAAPRFLRPRPPRSPLLRFSPLPASLSALTGASGASSAASLDAHSAFAAAAAFASAAASVPRAAGRAALVAHFCVSSAALHD